MVVTKERKSVMRVALNGKMASGKSTTVAELKKLYQLQVVSIGNEIKPLAASLIENKKLFEERIRRVIPNRLERESSIKEIYQFFDKNFSDAHWETNKEGEYIKNPPYRKFLQEFAMLIRNHFGEDIFAKLMMERISSHQSFIICDDLRLPGEKELLEKHGFLIIRLDIAEEEQKRRLIKTYGAVDEEALKHRTEVALDHATFDLRIDVTNKQIHEVAKEIATYLKNVNGVKV